jgi:hypothetical protein
MGASKNEQNRSIRAQQTHVRWSPQSGKNPLKDPVYGEAINSQKCGIPRVGMQHMGRWLQREPEERLEEGGRGCGLLPAAFQAERDALDDDRAVGIE